jgi:hypothetical protein
MEFNALVRAHQLAESALERMKEELEKARHWDTDPDEDAAEEFNARILSDETQDDIDLRMRLKNSAVSKHHFICAATPVLVTKELPAEVEELLKKVEKACDAEEHLAFENSKVNVENVILKPVEILRVSSDEFVPAPLSKRYFDQAEFSMQRRLSNLPPEPKYLEQKLATLVKENVAMFATPEKVVASTVVLPAAPRRGIRRKSAAELAMSPLSLAAALDDVVDEDVQPKGSKGDASLSPEPVGGKRKSSSLSPSSSSPDERSNKKRSVTFSSTRRVHKVWMCNLETSRVGSMENKTEPELRTKY